LVIFSLLSTSLRVITSSSTIATIVSIEIGAASSWDVKKLLDKKSQTNRDINRIIGSCHG
jgi:hypothetical protein